MLLGEISTLPLNLRWYPIAPDPYPTPTLHPIPTPRQPAPYAYPHRFTSPQPSPWPSPSSNPRPTPYPLTRYLISTERGASTLMTVNNVVFALAFFVVRVLVYW